MPPLMPNTYVAGMPVTEQNVELGKEWKALEGRRARDKGVFVRLAEKDRARYDKEMAEYTPSAAFLAELASAKMDPEYGESGGRSGCAVWCLRLVCVNA